MTKRCSYGNMDQIDVLHSCPATIKIFEVPLLLLGQNEEFLKLSCSSGDVESIKKWYNETLSRPLQPRWFDEEQETSPFLKRINSIIIRVEPNQK
jgi:hypothetical protein